MLSGPRTVLQTEAAECGLACLAMVADAHGLRESLTDLRRRFPVSLAGVNLKDLISISDALGFNARPVRCDLDELAKLQTPAILHWNLDHFVVLRRAGARHIWIADPGCGERRVAVSEASKHFTGVALELSPAPNFEKRNEITKVRLVDLWTRLRGFKPVLIQLFVLTFMLQAVGLLAPLSSQIVVDDVIGRGDRDLLVAVLIGFGALAIIQASIETLRGFIQVHIGQRISMQLTGNLLRHLMRLPVNFFERRHIGDILSRFGSLKPAQAFLTAGIVGVVLDATMVIPIGIVMLMYSPTLSAVVAVNLVVTFAIRMAAFPTVRRLNEEYISFAAKTDSVFMETVRAARAIKIAGREPERVGLWQNAFADQQNISFRQASFNLWGGAGFSFWQGVNGLALLYFGALQVIDGHITLGMLFAFQSYSGQFSGRINSLVGAFFSYRMLGLHLERLGDIVHAEAERGLDGSFHTARKIRGDIEVSNLRFRYGSYDPWVLNGVSFGVEAGESVAIIGPSGGGKSTLLKLMIGLYEPDEGDISIDGFSARAQGIRAIRGQLGVVMQDDQLLSGTIADNVAFFDGNIDMAQVEACCRTAHVHDDVMRTPMGYHSLVGDMGSILSGGQKQRILLARALYANPTILFMDEGTANLDGELERKVLSSLNDLKITRIMVAHRPAAIETADRLILVSNGTVAILPGLLRSDAPLPASVGGE